MGPCQPFHDLFLDFVYGALDPAEEEQVRAHLADCPVCQADLEKAQAQQAVLACAARVCAQVPAFELPADTLPATPLPASMPVAPAVLPLPARPGRRLVGRWTWVAAAAAILLAASGLWAVYQQGLEFRRHALAQARVQIKEFDARFAHVQEQLIAKQSAVPAQVRGDFAHLHVAGTARPTTDAPSPVRIATRDLAGKPLPALVSTRLVALDSGKELFRQDLPSKGDLLLNIPPGVGRDKTSLQVQARAGTATAFVKEDLYFEKPAFLSHLILNKGAYQAGDVLLFRSLVLERFSLKPAKEKLTLSYTLRDRDGRIVQKISGESGPGGIGGGEFQLGSALGSGLYTLQAAGDRIVPNERTLEIVRDQPPQFQFDRPQSGQMVTGTFNARRQGGAAVGNQDVTVKATVDGKAVGINGAAPGKPAKLRTDAFGTAPVQLQLPGPVEQGRALLEAEVKDADRAEKVVQPIPVAGPPLTVDFFPEGGDLVAGVANRVYYRVRTPQGEAPDPAGYTIRLSAGDVTLLSGRRPGAGVFTFTPRTTDKYTLRVTSAKGVTESATPFRGLKIVSKGVALHVPAAVSVEGEPLTVVLHNSGPARRLGVLATCRGNVVAEEFVAAAGGSTTLRLKPVAGANGVVRVAVYETTGDQLVPLAERLVYRIPAERLHLALSNFKAPARVGGQVDWQVKTTDERGNKTKAWLFAAVVDARVAADPHLPGPAGQFYLLSQLRQADDLEDANFLLSDTPEARRALDLFLGTYGWRRFVPTEGSDYAVARQEKGSRALLFVRENDTPARLRTTADLQVHKTLQELHEQALRERSELENDKKQAVQELHWRAAELARFRELPAVTLRVGAGLLALSLVILAGVFLVLGLVRLGRRKAAAGPFAATCGTLLACLLLYAGAGHLPAPPADRKEVAAASLPALADAPVTALQPATDGLPPAGVFAAVVPQKRAMAATATPEAASMRTENQRADRLANAHAQSRVTRNLDYRLQMGRGAKQASMMPAAKGNAPAAPGAGVGGGGDAKTAAKKADAVFAESRLREYAFNRLAKALPVPDTLLWQPALLAEDGTVRLRFDLPQLPGSYRVLLYGHTPSGRLGSFHGQLLVQP